MPNSSPSATLTAGAICITTLFFESYIASHTSSTQLFMITAPVGHTAAHCPHPTQFVSAIHLPKAGLTVIFDPLKAKSIAPTFCTSLHILTQSPHKMHLLESIRIDFDDLSICALFFEFLKRIFLTPYLMASS